MMFENPKRTFIYVEKNKEVMAIKQVFSPVFLEKPAAD